MYIYVEMVLRVILFSCSIQVNKINIIIVVDPMINWKSIGMAQPKCSSSSRCEEVSIINGCYGPSSSSSACSLSPSCSGLLRNPNIVDLVRHLVALGRRLVQVMDLVCLYEAIPIRSRPPIHGADDVASGNKTGCRSNQHFLGFLLGDCPWSNINSPERTTISLDWHLSLGEENTELSFTGHGSLSTGLIVAGTLIFIQPTEDRPTFATYYTGH